MYVYKTLLEATNLTLYSPHVVCNTTPRVGDMVERAEPHISTTDWRSQPSTLSKQIHCTLSRENIGPGSTVPVHTHHFMCDNGTTSLCAIGAHGHWTAQEHWTTPPKEQQGHPTPMACNGSTQLDRAKVEQEQSQPTLLRVAHRVGLPSINTAPNIN